MTPPYRIGLSARLMYSDMTRSVLPTKTVHYAEESAANWLMAAGALVWMIPRPNDATVRSDQGVRLADYAEALDGLLLQGGSDIAPSHYSEEPLQPEWRGDAVRDGYELELLHEFLRLRKPVLGLCRGCQLINVALGGSLFQDLATQRSQSHHHRHEVRYDANLHDVSIVPDSALAALYPGTARACVNSIHHQAIKTLGRGLAAEAHSEPDGVVEAIRWNGPSYLVGVQWHPEFGTDEEGSLLSSEPLRREFLAACGRARADAARTAEAVSAAV